MFLKQYENKIILVNLFDFFVVNFCLNYGNYIIVLILNVPFFEGNFLEHIYTAMHLFEFCYLAEIKRICPQESNKNGK